MVQYSKWLTELSMDRPKCQNPIEMESNKNLISHATYSKCKVFVQNLFRSVPSAPNEKRERDDFNV